MLQPSIALTTVTGTWWIPKHSYTNNCCFLLLNCQWHYNKYNVKYTRTFLGDIRRRLCFWKHYQRFNWCSFHGFYKCTRYQAKTMANWLSRVYCFLGFVSVFSIRYLISNKFSVIVFAVKTIFELLSAIVVRPLGANS